MCMCVIGKQEQRLATKENVQRKQARTGTEREDENEEHFSDSDSDEEEEVIYNPKNLPLGWDGKVGIFVPMVGHCLLVSCLLNTYNPKLAQEAV